MSNKELKELQKEWYAKLKEEGFEDIEYFDSDLEPKDWLKGNSKFSPIWGDEQIAATHDQRESSGNLDYYLQATALLHKEDVFASDTEREIWEMHADGLSLRSIGKQVGFSHPKVMRIIKRIRRKHFG